MNKVLRAMLLGIALLLLICGNSYADGSLFGHGTKDKVLCVVIGGTSGVVSTITSSNRILGYSVTGSANAVVGLYDSGTFFTEGSCLANDMKTVWFPFPKDLISYLDVQVNASTTIVTIFYE